MKKLILATSALVCAGSALAADLPARMPVKAPVLAPPPFSWTGCYIGGHVGYAWGQKDFADPTGGNFAPLGTAVGVDTEGWLGGGQIGCNYQFASNWVIGIEGEYSWADINGDADAFFGGKNNVLSAKTESIASATARLGYSWNRTLFYAKGGAAWAEDKYSVFLPGVFLLFPDVIARGSETRFGWTIGAGFEWAFANNWSAKIEYNHYDFGSRTINLFDPLLPLAIVPVNVDQRIDAVKVGINYRFW
jgi:outer membrane immunogenic protein